MEQLDHEMSPGSINLSTQQKNTKPEPALQLRTRGQQLLTQRLQLSVTRNQQQRRAGDQTHNRAQEELRGREASSYIINVILYTPNNITKLI